MRRSLIFIPRFLFAARRGDFKTSGFSASMLRFPFAVRRDESALDVQVQFVFHVVPKGGHSGFDGQQAAFHLTAGGVTQRPGRAVGCEI